MRTKILENKIKHIMNMLLHRELATTITIDNNQLVIDGRIIVTGTKSDIYRHLNTVESILWLVPVKESSNASQS